MFGEPAARGDLERQVGRISRYCVEKKYDVIETLDEVGSGMNEDRAKLKRIFKLVSEHKIDKVVVEHKDRLARFSFSNKIYGKRSAENRKARKLAAQIKEGTIKSESELVIATAKEIL